MLSATSVNADQSTNSHCRSVIASVLLSTQTASVAHPVPRRPTTGQAPSETGQQLLTQLTLALTTSHFTPLYTLYSLVLPFFTSFLSSAMKMNVPVILVVLVVVLLVLSGCVSAEKRHPRDSSSPVFTLARPGCGCMGHRCQ